MARPTREGSSKARMKTEQLLQVQTVIAVAVLLLLWLLEAWLPLFVDRRHRLRHAVRNLVMAGINGDGSVERATPRTLWIGVRLR